MHQTYRLDFLSECALDPERALLPDERAALAVAHEAFAAADAVVVRLGGKAGRLGESIVATGLLEGLFLALRALGKAGIPIHLIVDAGVAELFDARVYRQRLWPAIHVTTAAADQALDAAVMDLGQVRGERVLVVDLHGAHDGPPRVLVEAAGTDETSGATAGPKARHLTTLAHLARVGLRGYAQRGPQRRYADFIEDLFGLPPGMLEGNQAQPRIGLSAAARARYPRLARALRLDRAAIQVVCCFQSVVIAKCYQRWDEVLLIVCEQLARRWPGQRIDFLIACGPDADLPPGVRQADLAADFASFTGVEGNARVLVAATAALRDLAVVLSRASLALTNDTGPGHLAGALGIPTVTPYLPGNLYARQVWASTLCHRGVTLDPSPYRFEQLREAVLWDHTDIIDSIPPDWLAAEALGVLEGVALREGFEPPPTG